MLTDDRVDENGLQFLAVLQDRLLLTERPGISTHIS